MTIIPADEREHINEIIDYIIDNPTASVFHIKQKFKLSDDEYNMISDLMMPAQKQYSKHMHYRIGLNRLLTKLRLEKEAKEHAARETLASA